MNITTIARIAESKQSVSNEIGNKLIESALKSYRHRVNGYNTGEAHLIEGDYVLVRDQSHGDMVFTLKDFENSFDGAFLENALKEFNPKPKKSLADRLEAQAAKNGNRISIGNALDWNKTAQKARQWYNETRLPKKLYAYSVFSNGYNAWVEPTLFFRNLKDLKENLKENGLI